MHESSVKHFFLNDLVERWLGMKLADSGQTCWSGRCGSVLVYDKGMDDYSSNGLIEVSGWQLLSVGFSVVFPS